MILRDFLKNSVSPFAPDLSENDGFQTFLLPISGTNGPVKQAHFSACLFGFLHRRQARRCRRGSSCRSRQRSASPAVSAPRMPFTKSLNAALRKCAIVLKSGRSIFGKSGSAACLRHSAMSRLVERIRFRPPQMQSVAHRADRSRARASAQAWRAKTPARPWAGRPTCPDHPFVSKEEREEMPASMMAIVSPKGGGAKRRPARTSALAWRIV